MKAFSVCALGALLLCFFVSLGDCGLAPVFAEQETASALTCDLCKLGVFMLKEAWQANATDQDITDLAIDFCIKFKIEDETVCKGIVPPFEPMLVQVVSYEAFAPDYTCGKLNICPPVNSTNKPWNVTFPKPKPPHVPPTPPQPDSPRMYIVHLSDIHYDPSYIEGMNTDCGEPLCCRAVNGPGPTNATQAGFWGDYRCDLNEPMFKSLLAQLNQLSPAPTYVFWTGDNPPHDVWMQSQEKQINSSARIAQALKDAFGDITVIPAVGNHEGFPVNSFPLSPGSDWLYDALEEQWSVWIQDADALSTLKYGGYYTVVTEPGVRMVSLNMNYCNNGNAWLWMNETDPGHMLEWLVGVLQTAEDNQEKVFMLGHIPPGVGDCVEPWSSSFYEIVNRYEDTIVAQFYGHTHDDQFQIFYDFSSTPPRPTNVAYITPSGTTFTNQNPAYRIYEVDIPTKYIVDTKTYYADVELANLNNQPKWVLEYSAIDAFNMTYLFPTDWDQLATNLANDEELFQNTYWQFYWASSPAGQSACTGNCYKSQTCGMKSARVGLYKQCMGEALYEGGVARKAC